MGSSSMEDGRLCSFYQEDEQTQGRLCSKCFTPRSWVGEGDQDRGTRTHGGGHGDHAPKTNSPPNHPPSRDPCTAQEGKISLQFSVSMRICRVPKTEKCLEFSVSSSPSPRPVSRLSLSPNMTLISSWRSDRAD